MMLPKVPLSDGEVNTYDLLRSGQTTPRIYFVNGIRVPPRSHAVTASLLSILTEHPIHGIYNKTNGAIIDLGQSALDYLQNAGARPSSSRNLNRSVPDHEVEDRLRKLLRSAIVWNKATLSLVKNIVQHRRKRQMIIAHSQGNLITSNALFVVEDLLGAAALRNIRVYSLASPAPAWPLGLRRINGGGGRQENAFMNDLVMLLRPHNLAAKLGVKQFQNEGDFRTHQGSGTVSIAPHDTNLNIALNFLASIRGDLGISKTYSADFIETSSQRIQDTFGSDPAWKKYFEALEK